MCGSQMADLLKAWVDHSLEPQVKLERKCTSHKMESTMLAFDIFFASHDVKCTGSCISLYSFLSSHIHTYHIIVQFL